MLNFILRVVLFFLGLVVAASLVCAVLLLAAVWFLRAGWAKITGKPVTPWVMRFNPRSGFDRFTAAGRAPEPTAADVTNARARGESVRSPIALGDADDVTDVRARPVTRD
ncbi:MAG: hypothetical protein JWQ41_1072 [Variovorax sp.]|nr:hypothetical protein [Variovorax sp.]